MVFFPDIGLFKNYFEMGGDVMYPLTFAAILLWYALTYRALTLRSSRYTPRELVKKAQEGELSGNRPAERTAITAIELSQKSRSITELKSMFDEHLLAVKNQLNRHKILVTSLVAVAPLLGLLGTVDGMIETFDSLGDMVLFSQSGGIAGGISKALFTTQIGLVISIPGLLLGKVIDRREQNILREIYQIRDLVSMKPDTR